VSAFHALVRQGGAPGGGDFPLCGQLCEADFREFVWGVPSFGVVVVSLVFHWVGFELLLELGPSRLWMVAGECPLHIVGPLASRFSSVVPMGGLRWVRVRENWFGRRCGDGAVCLVCGGGLAMEMGAGGGGVWAELSYYPPAVSVCVDVSLAEGCMIGRAVGWPVR
jgi:hypothetical protein